MAEITSAECTVCGKAFHGENCLEKAEEHEKIPVGKPVYKIGDTLVYPKEHGYCRITVINHIGFSQDGHKVTYNGMHNCMNVFKLPVTERDGICTISKVDLLNSPSCADLRSRLLEISINDILADISRNKEMYKIDKVFGYEK